MSLRRQVLAGAIAAASGASLLVGVVGTGASQTVDTPDYQKWTVTNGEIVNRYEQMYGPPEFWTLTLLVGPDARRDVPNQQSIRTIGRLQVMERPGQIPLVDLCVEDTNDCLPLDMPVREISNAFFGDASFHRNEMAEVVGVYGANSDAFAAPPAPTVQSQRPQPVTASRGGFLFWSFSAAPPFERAARQRTVTLEDLIIEPEAFVGRTVVVRGAFRGRNLFDDMPGKSARGRDDWVLKDGPCFVWVTGHPPRGDGFTLRLDDRGASDYRLEVEGVPELRDGLVYLEASTVRLLGRQRDTGDEGPEG